MLKHKRIISIVFAVLFLLVLFLIKTGFFSKNPLTAIWNNEESLVYDNTTISELVYRDTDGDGIPDWEENLWGTDPTKKETTPGIPDSTAVNKLKISQELSLEGDNTVLGDENLTETDKLSRELFSTVTSLTQAGAMDQTTINKISTLLSEQIKNFTPQKVYELSDIKITEDDSVAAIKKYDNNMDSINAKYPVKGGIVEILQKFIIDENTVDPGALAELDSIIKPTQGKLDAILKIEVPRSIVSLHLDFINKIEIFIENLNNIKLYESDPIIALGAISQFEKNMILLESSVIKLKNAISQKLNN